MSFRCKKSTASGRRAFTLVELLVVIAIIGVLIGLLLPAVQRARESARRSTCTNNMKQIGLGLLTFENVNKAFPKGITGHANPGFTVPMPPWRIAIFPFVELNSLFDRMAAETPNAAGRKMIPSGYGGGVTPGAATFWEGVVLPQWRCPSSPTTAVFAKLDGSGNIDNSANHTLAAPDPVALWGGSRLSLPMYVGVMGAVDVPGTYSQKNIGVGFITDNGMLRPNQFTKVSECTDGLSKTLIVGEQSGLTGGRYRWSGAGHWFPWGMEWDKSAWQWEAGDGPVAGVPEGNGNYRAVGLTAVRYASNNPSTPAGADTGDGQNTTFSSMHSGGVNLLRGDGSVAFVGDGVAIDTLKFMASMNDGRVYSE